MKLVTVPIFYRHEHGTHGPGAGPGRGGPASALRLLPVWGPGPPGWRALPRPWPGLALALQHSRHAKEAGVEAGPAGPAAAAGRLLALASRTRLAPWLRDRSDAGHGLGHHCWRRRLQCTCTCTRLGGRKCTREFVKKVRSPESIHVHVRPRARFTTAAYTRARTRASGKGRLGRHDPLRVRRPALAHDE